MIDGQVGRVEEGGVTVGVLIYGPQSAEFEFDDRLLAHLRVVIIMKLRRRESFTFTWEFDPKGLLGPGRMCLWIDSSIPLMFRFYGSREPALNRAWIDALASVAASSAGLIPIPEPVGATAMSTAVPLAGRSTE